MTNALTIEIALQLEPVGHRVVATDVRASNSNLISAALFVTLDVAWASQEARAALRTLPPVINAGGISYRDPHTFGNSDGMQIYRWLETPYYTT